MDRDNEGNSRGHEGPADDAETPTSERRPDPSTFGAFPTGTSLPASQSLPRPQTLTPQPSSQAAAQAQSAAAARPGTASAAAAQLLSAGAHQKPAHPSAPGHTHTSHPTNQSTQPYPGPAPLPGYPPAAYAPQPYQQPGYGPAPVPPGYAYPQPPAYPYPGHGYAQVPPGYGYTAWGSPPPPGPAQGLAWAGIGVRFGALAVDAIFFCIFGVALSLFMNMPGLETVDGKIQYQTLANVIDVASWLIVLLYVPVCWYFFAGTPGQRLLKLRIVRATDGGRLGIGRIVLRYLTWGFCMIMFLIPAAVAGIFAAENPRKRAWPDLAGDSVVVREL